MNADIIILYSVVSFFYIISPGPAIFLAIANGLSAGMKPVAFSTLGNVLGLFILSAISMVGLGSIILASATLFFSVKVIGAVYLIYLGLKQIKASKGRFNSKLSVSRETARLNTSYFIEGFFLAVTNPKPILFFIAIFPQFLDIKTPLAPQFFVMTSLFMALSFISLFSYGYVGKSAKKLFKNKLGMKWFHRITGGLFIVMGFGLLQLKNVQS